MLLDVGDMEGVLREGGEQCGVCWKRLYVIEEVVPRHAKRHTGDSVLQAKRMRAYVG